MFCCDKGISVVPDTLFKVSKLLAVTLFWFSAKEKSKKQLTLNSLMSNNSLPFENTALQTASKMRLSKVFSFNTWQSVRCVCIKSTACPGGERVCDTLFLLSYVHTCMLQTWKFWFYSLLKGWVLVSWVRFHSKSVGQSCFYELVGFKLSSLSLASILQFCSDAVNISFISSKQVIFIYLCIHLFISSPWNFYVLDLPGCYSEGSEGFFLINIRIHLA